MFYEIALIAVCVAIPFFCLFSFREGLRYAGRKPERIEPVKAVKRKLKEGKATREQERKQREVDILSQNMLNYDGTGKGQVKIK